MVNEDFLEALSERLTIDDLCTYLDLESEDIVERFKDVIQRQYGALAEIIGWTSLDNSE